MGFKATYNSYKRVYHAIYKKEEGEEQPDPRDPAAAAILHGGDFIRENETRIALLMEPSARDTLAQANSGTIQAKPNLKTRAASRITSYNPQAGNQSIFPAPA